MSGGWMAFRVDIRTRPDVIDVDAHLARGLDAVRGHPMIAEATYRHDASTHTISFEVQLRRPVAHIDAITAHRALHESLERDGFGDTRLPPYSPVPVRLRIDSWPEFIC